jgi:predicted RNA binding protein YcfA (HicA-like mRNA interferase family)
LSKIPLLSALEIIKILAIFGFKPVRQTGSHIHLQHPETRATRHGSKPSGDCYGYIAFDSQTG